MTGAAKSGSPLNGRRSAFRPPLPTSGEADEEGRKRSVALQLIDLALDGYCLGVSEKMNRSRCPTPDPTSRYSCVRAGTGFRQELAQRFLS